MPIRAEVQLIRVRDNIPVPAWLTTLTTQHLNDFRTLWRDRLRTSADEDQYWDWEQNQTSKSSKEALMEFKITTEEALKMAKFEEEANCNISAGTDWGIHLDKVMELALNPIDPDQLLELIRHQLGNILSLDEIEDLVANFQTQAQAKIAEKLTLQKSV
jgi:hypothetical protein